MTKTNNMKKNVARTQRRKKSRAKKTERQAMTVYRQELPSAGGTIISRRSFNPLIVTSSNRLYTTVCNTERVGDVIIDTGFNTGRHTFGAFHYPWLNGIARNYSKYSWAQLRYIYIPHCPSTTSGSVVLSPGYDQADLAPTNLAQMQSSFRSVTAPIWAGWEGAPLLHNFTKREFPGAVSVDVDVNQFESGNSLLKLKYISESNFTSIIGPVEQNIYSPGYLDIGTSGALTSTSGGTLFIQYCVQMFEPIDPENNEDQ